MAKTLFAISLLVGAGACSSPAPTAHRSGSADVPVAAEPEPTTATTTSTTPEPVEEAPTTTRVTRARSAPTTTEDVAPSRTVATVATGDFWYRLATCESGNGAGSANQFQFMGGTAEKVGYYPGASYAEQVAMAQDWAARIHPNEGSTAGWPACWAVALG